MAAPPKLKPSDVYRAVLDFIKDNGREHSINASRLSKYFSGPHAGRATSGRFRKEVGFIIAEMRERGHLDSNGLVPADKMEEIQTIGKEHSTDNVWLQRIEEIGARLLWPQIQWEDEILSAPDWFAKNRAPALYDNRFYLYNAESDVGQNLDGDIKDTQPKGGWVNGMPPDDWDSSAHW
tara:strand:- start:3784 stop:4320 length:537 start_codon:yes stop_codon:yes gene_type:complete